MFHPLEKFLLMELYVCEREGVINASVCYNCVLKGNTEDV